MKRLLRVIGLIIIWIVLTIVFLEIGIRLVANNLGGQIGVVARYVATGQPFTEAWTPAWRENRDHYYALRPGVTDELQYGSPSVSFRLTTHKLWDDGLPADEGIGFRTRPIDYRVDAVVVGDSFTFCFNELIDCWVTQLAAQTGMGVANLGMPVTGSLSHAKILADFGAPLEPPLVIWQFFGNDFNDDYGLLSWRGDIEPITDTSTPTPQSETLHTWLTRRSATYAIMELLVTGRWSGFPDTEQIFTPQYSAVINNQGDVLHFGKLYERSALDMSRPANQYGLEQTRRAFVESQALIEAWGGELLVVIIPTREEVYEHITEPLMGATELDKQRSARLAMLSLCDELELRCIDPFDAFKARALQGEMLYYSDDMHLNARGNSALAQIVAEALSTREP